MRERKYKAWDKKTKRVAEVVAIVFSDFIDIEGDCDSKLGDPIVFAGVWICTDKDCLFVEHREFDQVELMEYTGRKDKNGTEIYEGDICKFVESSDEWVDLIRFNNGAFLFQDLALYEYLDEGGKCELEIIGNKYDNPRLMPK